VLELELARAGRQGGEVSVAMFDVDGFAAINETDGRAAGDAVLRRVAEVLGGSVRLVDTIARTGADEFVVVAPGSAGSTVAQRVIDGVAVAATTDGTAASVSAGVAHFPATHERRCAAGRRSYRARRRPWDGARAPRLGGKRRRLRAGG
jgi:diguanylate cyclase (GGDEF)-like protein